MKLDLIAHLVSGIVGGLIAVVLLVVNYSPNVQGAATQFVLFGQVIHHIYWGIFATLYGSLLQIFYLNSRHHGGARYFGDALLVFGTIFVFDDTIQHYFYGSPFILLLGKYGLKLLLRMVGIPVA